MKKQTDPVAAETVQTKSDQAVAHPRLVAPPGGRAFGRAYSTASLIGTLIAAEESRNEALETLAWVTKEMGISGEEIAHWQKEPDVNKEAKWDTWSKKADSFLHNA